MILHGGKDVLFPAEKATMLYEQLPTFDDNLNRLIIEEELGHWDVNQIGFEKAKKWIQEIREDMLMYDPNDTDEGCGPECGPSAHQTCIGKSKDPYQCRKRRSGVKTSHGLIRQPWRLYSVLFFLCLSFFLSCFCGCRLWWRCVA